MSDTFKLSLGLAQQLEFAFARNGWTSEEVHLLCRADMLSHAKVALLPHEEQGRSEGGMTLLSTAEVARLRAVERRYVELCERVHATASIDFKDEPIEQVLTKEIARELGFKTPLVALLLNHIKGTGWRNGVREEWGIRTLGDLLAANERELMRVPFVGETGISFIRKVLEVRGLKFEED